MNKAVLLQGTILLPVALQQWACFLPCRLDKYVELVEHSPDGVLSEDDIEALCNDIHEHDLLEPLMELRKQNMRRAGKSKAEYVSLPQQDPVPASKAT